MGFEAGDRILLIHDHLLAGCTGTYEHEGMIRLDYDQGLVPAEDHQMQKVESAPEVTR